MWFFDRRWAGIGSERGKKIWWLRLGFLVLCLLFIPDNEVFDMIVKYQTAQGQSGNIKITKFTVGKRVKATYDEKVGDWVLRYPSGQLIERGIKAIEEAVNRAEEICLKIIEAEKEFENVKE